MRNVVQKFASAIAVVGVSDGKLPSAQSRREFNSNSVRGFLLFALAFTLTLIDTSAAEIKLLNVSYDVTREFYKDYNKVFTEYWKTNAGDTVTVNQSHGGSSKQAQSVLNGLEADVVTMNQPLDIDILNTAGNLIPANWSSRLPNKSVPYTSTIVFVVRKGNPKDIRNWDDLVRSNISVVIPNPKTSGNGRYCYLAGVGVRAEEIRR